MYIVITGLKFGYWPSVAVRVKFVVGDNDGGGGSGGGGAQDNTDERTSPKPHL